MRPDAPHDASGAPRRFRSLDDPESLRLFVRNVREGIYITTGGGEFLDANAAFLELLGVSSLEELRRHRVQDLIVDRSRRQAELDTLVREGSVHEHELDLVRPDGRTITVLDTCYVCRDESTGEVLFHGILSDVTQRKAREETLRQQVIRDPLTGCFNRRFLDDLAEQLTVRGGSWGVVYIDIDHFKRYNDENGHRRGDTVLIRMSRFLMRQVRAEEAVVRVGGDEFVVVLEGAESAQVQRVVDRMQLEGLRSAPVPFSLGWAVRQDGEAFQQTVHRADRHMMDVRATHRGAPGEIRKA